MSQVMGSWMDFIFEVRFVILLLLYGEYFKLCRIFVLGASFN